MAKLLITLQGVALREVSLADEETTIGRRSRNRVVMDTAGVSGEHAVVRRVGTELYIEDRGSTNGTLVNGQPIKRQILRSGDSIEIGEYRLRFDAEERLAAGSADRASQASRVAEGARLRVLFGPHAGREYRLRKTLTRLGRTGHETAVIIRRGSGYFIEHHRGDVFPSVNGVDIGSAPHPLAEFDVIEVAGAVVQFLGAEHSEAPAPRPAPQPDPASVREPAPAATQAGAATGTAHVQAGSIPASPKARVSLPQVATDRLRNLLHIRTPRAVPMRGPRPNPGARICCENLRMTVQAGMTGDLWNWLQDAGWREITYRPDRRHYCEIPTECVYELIECAADERRHVLDSSIEHARDGRLPFLNALLDPSR